MLTNEATATLYKRYITTPIGLLHLTCSATEVVSVLFADEARQPTNSNSICTELANQLTHYFEGKLQQFTLPLAYNGTAFQTQVWQLLTTIAYGTTISYTQQALQLGNPLAIRAMASANGKNPFTILVPCHRVVGAKGTLTGYSGGLWRKQWLLQHEATLLGKWGQLF